MDYRPAEFHCGYSETEMDVLAKGRGVLQKYGSFLNHPLLIDLGCGEGALLLALKRAGHKEIFGVDSNEELLRIARTVDVPLVESDIWEYLKSETLRPGCIFLSGCNGTRVARAKSNVVTMPSRRQSVNYSDAIHRVSIRGTAST